MEIHSPVDSRNMKSNEIVQKEVPVAIKSIVGIQEIVEKTDVENLISRNWSLKETDIQVNVSNNHVTLSGTTSSFCQKNEAERIAWNAPGVLSIDNKITFN